MVGDVIGTGVEVGVAVISTVGEGVAVGVVAGGGSGARVGVASGVPQATRAKMLNTTMKGQRETVPMPRIIPVSRLQCQTRNRTIVGGLSPSLVFPSSRLNVTTPALNFPKGRVWQVLKQLLSRVDHQSPDLFRHLLDSKIPAIGTSADQLNSRRPKSVLRHRDYRIVLEADAIRTGQGPG